MSNDNFFFISKILRDIKIALVFISTDIIAENKF